MKRARRWLTGIARRWSAVFNLRVTLLWLRASQNGRILFMPEKKTLKRARKDKREGKAPTTQAGEFVHE